MKIALTVDPLRPGQDQNLPWFAAIVAPLLGGDVRAVAPQAADWHDWLVARFSDRLGYADAIGECDLIVGFELPPAVREGATPWIDVRRHPKCYDPARVGFSIRASFATEEALALAEAPAPRLPFIAPVEGVRLDTVFALQVRGDAQMLVPPGRLVVADDVIPALKALAEESVLWLAPHPQDPATDWIGAIQDAIPGAEVWRRGTYAAMASMRRLVTWTSSCGFEAPDFGCNATFLGKPFPFSHGFYPLDCAENWRALLDTAQEAVAA